MNKLRLIKLHFESSDGEKALTSFIYNENGLMHKARWSLLDGSLSSENYNSFDVNGNMVRKYREFSNGMTSDLIYEYDEAGNLTSEDFSRSDGLSGRTVFEYDDKGCPTKAICNKYYTFFDGLINFECDKDGKKIKGRVERDGKNIGEISFRYNEAGNLLIEEWQMTDWWMKFVYKYEKVD